MTDTPIDAGTSEAARTALASLIDLHGPALLHEPDRLKRQLDGALPDAPREVGLILSSMSEEVPHTLLAAHSDEQLRPLFAQLVERLVRTGTQRGAATWAVRTWAHALAVAVEGRDTDRPDGLRRAADRRATAGGAVTTGEAQITEASTERRMLEEREASRRASTAEVLGFGTRPVRAKAPSTVRAPGPGVSPPPAAETLVAFDAIRERAVDAAPGNGADAALEDASSSPPIIAEAPAALADESKGDDPVAVLPATSAPEPMPPVASGHEPVDLPSRSTKHDQLPIVAAMAEATAAPAVEATPAIAREIEVPIAPPAVADDDVKHVPPPDVTDEPATLAFAPQRRSSSRTFALAAAIAAAVIVVGATLWPAPQQRAAPDASPPASATPITRATPAPAPAPAPVAPATIAAVTAAPTTTAPVSPPPLDKPNEPAAPAVPPAIATGAPIEPQGKSELRVPSPEKVPAPAREAASPVRAEVTVPAVIPAKPPAPTPAPRIVRQPDAPVSKAVAAAPTAPAASVTQPAKAAEPRKPAATPLACTRSTCGSVVSVRAIDDAATRDYEVIVRLDDRTIRAVRMPARWSLGARVRVVGSRFEPASDR